MNVPSYLETPVVDANGYFTSTWRQIISQLLTESQNNLSDEGFVIPGQSDTNIEFLNTEPNSLKNGTLLYDTTNNVGKMVINGIIKTIATS